MAECSPDTAENRQKSLQVEYYSVGQLSKMTEQFSVVQKVISTGSNIVDAILNEKYRECSEKGINTLPLNMMLH